VSLAPVEWIGCVSLFEASLCQSVSSYCETLIATVPGAGCARSNRSLRTLFAHALCARSWTQFLTSGFAKYLVAYASTALEVVKNYNTLTLVDALNVAFDSLFRLSTLVVTLVGSLITWVSVPFIGLLLYHLLTSEDTLSSRRSRVAVIAASGVMAALAFALPPNIGADAARGADVAEGADATQSVLCWVAPAVVTKRVASRPAGINLFGAFFLFAAVSSVLQITLFLLF